MEQELRRFIVFEKPKLEKCTVKMLVYTIWMSSRFRKIRKASMYYDSELISNVLQSYTYDILIGVRLKRL